VGGFDSARLRKYGGTIRAAVRILIDYLLEQGALNDHSETQTEADSELVAEPQTVQLRFVPISTSSLAVNIGMRIPLCTSVACHTL
jgi:hypothetical protein